MSDAQRTSDALRSLSLEAQNAMAERRRPIVSARELLALVECAEALKDLLSDTQHVDHDCGDSPDRCPVLRSRLAVKRLEAL